MGQNSQPRAVPASELHAEKALELAPKDPERHYWIAATDSIFTDLAKDASTTEYATILDEGIQHGTRAIEADPTYWDAMAVLAKLYRKKAAAVEIPSEHERLLRLAEAATREATPACAMQRAEEVLVRTINSALRPLLFRLSSSKNEKHQR